MKAASLRSSKHRQDAAIHAAGPTIADTDTENCGNTKSPGQCRGFIDRDCGRDQYFADTTDTGLN